MGERMANEEMVKSSYWTSLFIELVLGDGEERKLYDNILFSKFFSNSAAQSDSNYPDAAFVQERVRHLISGDSEQ